jgi:hypothetical protein
VQERCKRIRCLAIFRRDAERTRLLPIYFLGHYAETTQTTDDLTRLVYRLY